MGWLPVGGKPDYNDYEAAATGFSTVTAVAGVTYAYAETMRSLRHPVQITKSLLKLERRGDSKAMASCMGSNPSVHQDGVTFCGVC